MKQSVLLLSGLLLLSLCTGCGSGEPSSSASVFSVESAAESTENSVQDSAEESAAEESAVEEEEEPTIDEQFADLTADVQGVCLKLQVYNQKGTPVRRGQVTLQPAEGKAITEDTDYSGFALLLDLSLDTEYTVTVTYGDESPVGTTSFTLQAGDSYAGGADGAAIRLEVGNGETSLVDMAITATDENGGESGFTISRIAAWTLPAEDE